MPSNPTARVQAAKTEKKEIESGQRGAGLFRYGIPDEIWRNVDYYLQN